MKRETLNDRIRDHLSPEWLTPSQQAVWAELRRFDGPPHRVVNVFGPPGSGKSFLGWLMRREGYATYGYWANPPRPIHPRLALDNAATDHAAARDARPLVDQYQVRQVILLSRRRVDEPAMPAFELRVTADDLDCLRGNLYHYFSYTLPEVADGRNYHDAIDLLLRRLQENPSHGRQ
jgi:hypothetical protein